MALFNKSSSSEKTINNSQPSQDISSLKSSMNEKPTNLNTSNTSDSSKPPQNFVNPFSQEQSTPQAFNNNSNTNQPSSSFNQNQTQQNSPLPSFQEPSSQQNSFDQNQSFMMSQGQELNSPSFNPPGYSNSGEYISKDEVQSMIYESTEKILEQQWENLTGKVQKVIDWKSSVDNEVENIKEDINAMQEAFATLEKRLISKLNNYDKSILDVGSEIKALDKVFQKVTPTLVNNVTELGKIAKDLKGVSLKNSNNDNNSSKDND
mgnify:CR=1 FL=1